MELCCFTPGEENLLTSAGYELVYSKMAWVKRIMGKKNYSDVFIRALEIERMNTGELKRLMEVRETRATQLVEEADARLAQEQPRRAEDGGT